MYKSIPKGLAFSVYMCLSVALSACGSADEGNDATSAADESIQAGLSALSGAVNSGNDGSTSFASIKPTLYEKLLSGLTVEAAVSTCGIPARSDSCSSGVKSASYSNCSVGRQTYSGDVTLNFSDSSCSMSSINDYVVRTVDLSRTGFFNSTITTSSADHLDYRGNTIGGGSKLTRTGIGSLSLRMLGVRKLRTRATGASVYDIQSRTTSDLQLVGTWDGNRTIQSGSLEVIHNLAQYTATFSFDNVQYNKATCCYPTSGSISVAYSGSVSGNATVTFASCGVATIVNNGVTKNLNLAGCE